MSQTLRPGGIITMIELQSLPFMGAIVELRGLVILTEKVPDRSHVLGDIDRNGTIAKHLTNLIDALTKTAARSALASANRLQAKVNDAATKLTYQEVHSCLDDIESRFADHLSDIKFFVLNPQEASLLEPADNLLAFSGVPITGFSTAYPNASFEIEEAAKCIALSRYTASVFHCMRAIECGIKALCKLLGISDATKPAEKNWGIILNNIKDALDAKFPKTTRLPGSEGAKLEALYATLDAIKNPWRNATMHVETIYAPHEAGHIARCTGMFLLEMAKHCDEEGNTRTDSPAMAIVSAPKNGA